MPETNRPAVPDPAEPRRTGAELPRIAISYCTGCNWLLRAGWMAQELLAAFQDDIAAVSLEPATGGTFRIRVDDAVVWDRVRDGGFPDIRVLKQRVRDLVAPDRSLGHTDRVPAPDQRD